MIMKTYHHLVLSIIVLENKINIDMGFKQKIKRNFLFRGVYYLLRDYFLDCRRSRFGYIAEDVTLMPPLRISNPENVFLYGKNCLRNADIMVTNAKFIMKPHARAAEGLRVTTGNHHMVLGRFFSSITEDEKPKNLDKDVVVESDAWIGRNCSIMPGVTIGRGCTIGACSLISRDIPPYCVAVGVPAKPVKFKWTIDEILYHEEQLYSVEERYTREQLEKIFAEVKEKYPNIK